MMAGSGNGGFGDVGIATAQDFIDALERYPQFQAAVLRHLLTAELLLLPEKVDGLVRDVDGLVRRVDGLVRRVDGLARGFEEHKGEFRALRREFDEHRQEFVEHRREFVEHRQEFVDYRRETRQGFASLKGFHAKLAAEREAPFVASDLGFEYVRTLSTAEINVMALTLAQGRPIQGDLRSFRQADLIIEAEEDGQTRLIAVEASYTVDERDTSRAIRNAGFLERVTGFPATAVVAGMYCDRRIVPLLDGGEVWWYQMVDEIPDPE